MVLEWTRLLLGAVVFGVTIVATMVVYRRFHLLGIALGIFAGANAVAGLGAVVAKLGTAESVALALFFLFAGVIGGYWVSAAALPMVARSRVVPPLAMRDDAPVTPQGEFVVLLADAEPEHYDPRDIASNHRIMVESGALRIPGTAAPFIYLSEKARYRAIGGLLPARAAATSLTEKLASALAHDDRVAAVRSAWCTSEPSLAEVVREAYGEGFDSVLVAPLGSDASLPVGLAREALEQLKPRAVGMRVRFAPTMWHSTRLAATLCDRILIAASGVPRTRVGVVLVGEGQPPSWTASHARWCEQENYFAQRVRLHLAENDVLEGNVRLGWLEWQMPDVTETVRHLAAMGCTRIVVAPGLMPLPTLATAIDLEHSIRMARLSEVVSVVSLKPWSDDDAVAEVLAEGVLSTLKDH